MDDFIFIAIVAWAISTTVLATFQTMHHMRMDNMQRHIKFLESKTSVLHVEILKLQKGPKK